MAGVKRRTAVLRRIPTHLAKYVGHIITRWAFLEYQLSRITWRLLGITEQQGRLTVSTPRAKERFEAIRDLLFLEKRVIAEREFSQMVNALDGLQKKRDTLAHGIWTIHDGNWKIISTSGNVTDQTLHKVARKRKLRPEAMTVTVSALSDIVVALDAQLSSLERYVEGIRQAPDERDDSHHEVKRT